MKDSSKFPVAVSRRSLLGAGAGTMALTLLGCGGDFGGIAGVGSGGTGSFSSGPIRGLGSIIVGTVHYEERDADVFDDAGGAMSPDALRLGMVVDVNGSPTRTTSSGQRRSDAHTISRRTEIEGPVADLDLASGSFTVLGQEVRVTGATVFDEALHGGLQAIRTGDIVEVSGLLQGNGRYTATRIELEDDRVSRYKLRGVVSQLDTAAGTFRLGGALISWAGVTPVGDALANGRFVRVELDTQPLAGGAWRALDLRIAPSVPATLPGEGDEVELEGYISSVAAAGQRFELLGVTVDYSDARFEDGVAGDLAPGRRVEVEGRMSADGSVLVASEVEFEDDDGKFEIEGVVTRVSRAEQSFELRGVTVDYSQARFDDGTADDLVPGAVVEVEGRISADGTSLVATEIEFDDDDEIELEGTVSRVSAAGRTFVVQGVTVDYSQARFHDGTAGDLAPGVRVEVEGRMSADGSVLVASEVDFDD